MNALFYTSSHWSCFIFITLSMSKLSNSIVLVLWGYFRQSSTQHKAQWQISDACFSTLFTADIKRDQLWAVKLLNEICFPHSSFVNLCLLSAGWISGLNLGCLYQDKVQSERFTFMIMKVQSANCLLLANSGVCCSKWLVWADEQRGGGMKEIIIISH